MVGFFESSSLVAVVLMRSSTLSSAINSWFPGGGVGGWLSVGVLSLRLFSPHQAPIIFSLIVSTSFASLSNSFSQ